MQDVKGKGRAIDIDAAAVHSIEYGDERRSAVGTSSSHSSSSGSTSAMRARRTNAASSATASSLATPTPPPLARDRFIVKNIARRGDGTDPQKKVNKRQAGGTAGAGVGNVAQGYPACNDVGNNVLSCFPRSDTQVVQDKWSKFIWNLNYPTFIGAGYVDIHLFSADSEQQLNSRTNISNSRGSIGIDPNDAWLPVQETYTPGVNLTHSYYFIIATRGSRITGGEPHQATFEMIQTAAPSTLSASLAAASSASAASASSSASLAAESASLQSVISSLSAAGIIVNPTDSAALSSLASASSSLSSVLATNTALNPSSGPRNIQNDGSGANNVPKWAIALISVFGFLALLAGLAALWLLLRAFRRRRQERYAEVPGEGSTSHSSPMMQERSGERPISAGMSSSAPSSGTGGAVAGLLAGLGIGGAAASNRNKERETPDLENSPNKSTSYPQHARDSSELDTSNTAHTLAGKGSQRSLNSALNAGDAALISEAFRSVLRKPEFVHHEESGSSAGTHDPALASPSGSLGVGTIPPRGFGHEGDKSRRNTVARSMVGSEGIYGDKESDSEDAEKEGNELIKTELASEGTSARSVVDRKKPDYTA